MVAVLWRVRHCIGGFEDKKKNSSSLLANDDDEDDDDDGDVIFVEVFVCQVALLPNNDVLRSLFQEEWLVVVMVVMVTCDPICKSAGGREGSRPLGRSLVFCP